MLLEGEPELPKKILTNIHNEVDDMIQKGEKERPKNLIDLLNESDRNSNGLREFDSEELVPSLHSHLEHHNCWSLPIVTLTAIAMALPNISENHSCKVKKLESSVKLIEETVDATGEGESIRDAADVVWVGVELYHKWQDIDLKEVAREAVTNQDVLEKLSDRAEKIVADYFKTKKDSQNPLNWPGMILAANSMYRTCQTILLAHNNNNQYHQGEEDQDDVSFKRLSMMISDILAACLTNLPRVVIMKSHTFKEREESVRQAALLLGQSLEILRILHRHRLSN